MAKKSRSELEEIAGKLGLRVHPEMSWSELNDAVKAAVSGADDGPDTELTEPTGQETALPGAPAIPVTEPAPVPPPVPASAGVRRSRISHPTYMRAERRLNRAQRDARSQENPT